MVLFRSLFADKDTVLFYNQQIFINKSFHTASFHHDGERSGVGKMQIEHRLLT